MLLHRGNLFLTAFITIAVLTSVPGQALAQNQNTSAVQAALREKQVSSIQFYCDVQGGVSVPTGASLNTSFHDRDGIDVRLNGSWINPGNQGVGGKWGVNVGWWVNDDPASFLGHLGGNFNFSYNRLDFQRSGGSFKAAVTIAGVPDFVDGAVGTMDFGSRGDLFSLAHLFNYRRGVLPDDQSPFGRLQFYGGLGPALMINNQKCTSVNTFISNSSGKPGNPIPVKQSFGSQVDVSPGLMVQLGAKYFFTKNIYTNFSLDYRYFQSSFVLTGNGITHDHRINQSFGSKLHYNNNLFGINFGAGFQF